MDDVPEMMPEAGGGRGEGVGEAGGEPGAGVDCAARPASGAPPPPGPSAPPADVGASGEVQSESQPAPARRGRRRAVVVEIPIPPVEELSPVVEAVLLSTPRPVATPALASAAGLSARGGDDENAEPIDAHLAIEAGEGAVAGVDEADAAAGRPVRLAALAGGWRVMTLPKFAGAIAAFHKAREAAGLSRAALETLAIIAYKQPITRAELESIRGVACGEVLRSLIDKRLVTITGRAEELGRPLLYGTTRQFLDAFGLATLKDLPTLAELKLPN